MHLFKSSFVIIALFDLKSHKPTQRGGHVLPLPHIHLSFLCRLLEQEGLSQNTPHDRWQSYTRKPPKEEGGQGHHVGQLSYTPGAKEGLHHVVSSTCMSVSGLRFLIFPGLVALLRRKTCEQPCLNTLQMKLDDCSHQSVCLAWTVPNAVRGGVSAPADSGASGVVPALSISILFKESRKQMYVSTGTQAGERRVACLLDIVPGAHSCPAVLRITFQKQNLASFSDTHQHTRRSSMHLQTSSSVHTVGCLSLNFTIGRCNCILQDVYFRLPFNLLCVLLTCLNTSFEHLPFLTQSFRKDSGNSNNITGSTGLKL